MWKKLNRALSLIISYLSLRQTQKFPISWHPTYLENFFENVSGAMPKEYEKYSGYYNTEKVLEILHEEYSGDLVSSRKAYDSMSFEETRIYELYNTVQATMVQVTIKSHLPYQFQGERYSSDAKVELNTLVKARGNIEFAQKMAKNHELNYISQIEIVEEDKKALILSSLIEEARKVPNTLETLDKLQRDLANVVEALEPQK